MRRRSERESVCVRERERERTLHESAFIQIDVKIEEFISKNIFLN